MLSINQSINQSKNRFNMNRDINFSLFFFFFQILSQKKQELPVAAMFVNGSK
jgi:hypothetical protein